MSILPVAEFGRYTLIFTIATQILFLNKSLILNPMIRFAAEPGKFSDAARTGFWQAGILQLITGLLVITLAPLVAKILRIEYRDVVLAGALPLLFWIRDWGFCAQQILFRTGRLFLIEIVYYGGSAVGYVWLWTRGSCSASDVLFWNFLAAGVSTLVALMFWPKEAGTPFGFDRADARRIIRYGGFTVGLGVSAGLLAGADLIILGAIYTPEVVGVYGGAKRIYGVVSALISTAGLLVIPYVSRLNAEGRADETRALFEKAAAYIAAGLAAAVVVGWLLADPFYRYVMPAGYAASAPLFIILLTAAPFEGLYNITASVLYAMGSAGISVVISALGVVILAVALPLSAYYGGMLGAAWSQVAVTALVGVVMTWQAGRIVGAGLVSALGRLVQCIRGVFLLMSGR